MMPFINDENAGHAKRYSGVALDWVMRLAGITPMDGSKPLTKKQLKKTYSDDPSFVEFLPFRDYSVEDKVFHFYDDVSVGVVLEIKPIDVEGRPQHILEKVEKAIEKSIKSIPPHHESPWIVQTFLQDEPITGLVDVMRDYAVPDAKKYPHHEMWMKEMEEHLEHMSRDGGLFHDSISNTNWRGLSRKVRIVIYRRSKKEEWVSKTGKPLPGKGRPAIELRAIVQGFTGQLKNIGCQIKEYNDEDLFRWLAPWFMPNPLGFKNAGEYLKARKFPKNRDCFDAGADLSEMLLTASPESREDGAWLFQNKPSRLIAMQAIDTPPCTGVLTAEQETPSGKEASLWDKLPDGSIWVTTMVVLPKSTVMRHLDDIIKAGGQGSSEARASSAQAEQAKDNVADGRWLYPVFNGVYVSGRNDDELATNVNNAFNALVAANFNPINPRYDVTAIDNYLRFLPMTYQYDLDKEGANMVRMTYSDHIARIMPLYGRGTGTGKPGKVFFNRIGEPILFDPVRDRARVAHSLIFGPTGAGKSATINYMVLNDMAIYAPRTFIIEKGDSFGLLGDCLKARGFTVNKVKFSPGVDISLPPYAKAFEALEQAEATEEAMERALHMTADDSLDDDSSDADDEMRDYLGEMELITRMMITGADMEKEKEIEQADKMIIRKSILDATRKQRDEGKDYVIPSHIVDQLNAVADGMTDDKNRTKRERIYNMADALAYWCEGIHGKFFNRPGKAWPEVDITILDMGMLTADNYKDMLAVAVVSLINTITGIGEKYQYSGRQTQVYTDEGHAITTNPTLVKPFVFGAKTWRKLNIWLNQGTQQFTDYPDEAEKMISLAEWWYCLNMGDDDLKQLLRFKHLNEEQKALVVSANKEKGKYTEGVVISDNVTSLFRVVVPALPLVLAGTDDDEKRMRREVMDANNCTEIEAVYKIADSIKEKRLASV